MNAFVQHTTNTGLTENGCRTNLSSLNACVDLFFSGATTKEMPKDFIKKALKEDRTSALKICFYLRDVRDGQGKRDVLRGLIEVLLDSKDYKTLAGIMPYFPEIGRWKDVFEYASKYKNESLDVMVDMIKNITPDRFALMCKWMPRKGDNAKAIRNALQLDPKTYRKFVVSGTNVVEQLMCAKEWDKIDFNKLPSVAAKIYQNAFKKHCSTYQKYLDSLEKGEAKINASVLYPHDIVTNIRKSIGSRQALEAQWKALPDYMQNSEFMNIFPIIDTSGSMSSIAYGNTTCLDVAAGLGIYFAEHNRGAFKDVWCNFSTVPKIYKLKGNTLYDKIQNLDYSNWSGTTDLEAVFNLILSVSTENNVPVEDMPKIILIVSDMEFNSCARGSSAFRMIEKKYKAAGYEIPVIVFWNVQSRGRNVPVTSNQKNVVLIGGYSPSTAKTLLEGKLDEISPIEFMKKVITERYKYLEGI